MKTNPENDICYIVQKKIRPDKWSSITSKLQSNDAAIIIRNHIQVDAPEMELRIIRTTLVIDIVDIHKGYQL